MAGRICPWWLGYLLVTPLRRFFQDPQTILSPFLQEGMHVLEPGCGMGFFTIDMARLVGIRGKVIAVDVQPKMITALKRRVRKAGLDDRIEARIAKSNELQIDDLAGGIDFVLAFAVVHELPNQANFFAELRRALKRDGKLLLAEPKGHVSERKFAASLQEAERSGFHIVCSPFIRRSRTAVLVRS